MSEFTPHAPDLFGEPDNGAHGSRLGDAFLLPPFTVLNAREGWWQERKRAWLALGIQSELGRVGLDTRTPQIGKGAADGLIALRTQQKAARND